MTCVFQDTVYSRLKDHVIASTGLAFYADRDDLLTGLIGERLSALGLRDCSAYADILADSEQGSAEMDVLISQLTIGETYFFRDEAQFAAIRDVILPDILERNKYSRRLRIWSAGCATGAEPYSLAILLARELADRLADWQVEICATDLNRGYLAQAAEGRFRPWALRAVSDELKRDCFSQTDSTWTILPRYKQWISFHYMNLAKSDFCTPLFTGTHFDLILCRNVMIYFAPEVSRRMAAQFHQSLSDGGWLVVGASEHNQQNYADFRTVDASGATFYQRMPQPQELAETARQPQPQPLLPAAPEPAQPLANVRGPDRSHSPKGAANLAGLERLRELADGGDWDAAAEYGKKLLIEDRLNPAIHFYQALIFENLGRAGELERSLRQAIYLDRNFALAHYHLGLTLQRDRRTAAASRSFANVLQALAGLPDDAAVTAGRGVTAADLKELAKMHLESSGLS